MKIEMLADVKKGFVSLMTLIYCHRFMRSFICNGWKNLSEEMINKPAGVMIMLFHRYYRDYC